MPRLTRLRPIPFAWYYVALRVAPGRRLASTSADLGALVDSLRISVHDTGACLHAGYIDSEEVHLALQTGEMPVSAVTSGFTVRYVRYRNRVYGESGQLWRPHAHIILIQHGLWLVDVAHVIHWLHHLRARERGEAAFWSTDTVYRGALLAEWLKTDVVLRMLSQGSRNPAMRLDAYRRRFDVPPQSSVLERLRRGSPGDPRVLGDEAFVRAARTAPGMVAPARRGAPGRAVPEAALREVILGIIGQLLALCERGPLSASKAVWQTYLTVEMVRSHSRVHPLPMARALTVAFATQHRIATRTQLARFFACGEDTVSARRQRIYERAYQALLEGYQGLAPENCPRPITNVEGGTRVADDASEHMPRSKGPTATAWIAKRGGRTEAP